MLWIVSILTSGIITLVSSSSDFELPDFGDDFYGYESVPDSSPCKSLNDSINNVGSIVYYANKSYANVCWDLRTKSQAFITIRFSSILIPEDYDYHCSRYNQVIVQPYRNNYPDNRFTAKYCGTDLPTATTFYGTHVKISFDLNLNSFFFDTFRKHIGFELYYEFAPPDENLELQSWLYVTSHGYPQAPNYDSVSSWNISLSADLPPQPMEFIMNSWNVQSYVYLSIYDGPSKNSKLLRRLYSVNQLTSAIKSTGPHMYIELHAGKIRGDPEYAGFNATVKLKGVCLPGSSPCGDGENCFNDNLRCDLKQDCLLTGADERSCGGCRSGDFWCGGEIRNCYVDVQRCDGYIDCPKTKVDENHCDTCAHDAFLCKSSQKCIKKAWRCDGQSDCPNNEDEIGCTSGPSHQDVLVRSYHFITSPGYPLRPDNNSVSTWNVSLLSSPALPMQLQLNVWKVDASTSLRVYDGPSTLSPLLAVIYSFDQTNSVITGTGPHMYIELHVGNYRYTGSLFTGFNATVKIKGYCLPGSSPCGDGVHCFRESEKCDRKRDCYDTGLDERGCGECKPDEIWCGGDHFICYSPDERCNGKHECEATKADELNCVSCAPGAFLCKISNRCIYERWRCDGQSDCPHDEDEEDCTYPASRRVITAAIVGSLVCGLLLAVALGCTCKLYTLRNAAHVRNRRNRYLQTTPLGRVARELLQREAPPSYSMTVDAVENSGDHSRRHSSSSRRRRERQRRRRNREPRIRRAQAAPRPRVETRDDQGNNREDGLVSVESNPPSNRPTSSTSMSVDQSTQVSPASAPVNNSGAVDVVGVLAEMGLAEYPENHRETQQRDPEPAPPSTDTAETSQSNADAEQAPPLPKKNEIRPVLVEAPFNAVVVDDIASCVYPNPPSYHEATISETPPSLPPLQVNNPEDNKPSKPPSSSRNVLNKFWTKHTPSKRKLLKFPSFQGIFNMGQSNGGFHELRDTTSNVRLDDDQVQLISDFASDETSDDVSLLDVSPPDEDSVSNPTLNSDGSSVFELQSYNASNLPDSSREINENFANLESIPSAQVVLSNRESTLEFK